MAKILITYFSDYGETMYDAISNFLLGNGNDLIRFNINCPIVYMDKWGGHSELVDETALTEIVDFNPDVLLNFNNSCPVNLKQHLTNCVECILDADNPETFFNQEHLRLNNESCKFLGFQSYSKKMYESFLGRKLSQSEFLYFPPATTVQKKL